MRKLIPIIVLTLLLTSCAPRKKTVPELSGEELQAFIEQFPIEEIPLPDGSFINKSEAVSGKNNGLSQVLYFDFGVIRYAEPIFDIVTFGNSDNYDVIEFPECITVKAGDILENGMTVENAQSAYICYNSDILPENRFDCAELTLSGEAELWGVLTVSERDWEYGFQDEGDILFYPDGSKSKVPLFYSDGVFLNRYYTDDTVIVYDGEPLFLGNIKDYGGDLRDVKFSEARVTVKNLHLKGSVTNGGTAELVEWELL